MKTHMEDDDQFQFWKRFLTYLNLPEADEWRQSCSVSFRSEWKQLIRCEQVPNYLVECESLRVSNGRVLSSKMIEWDSNKQIYILVKYQYFQRQIPFNY